jgi:hypothetical protein
VLLGAGCGSDDATNTVQDVKDQAEQVREDIRSGASKAEIQDKIDELQRNAQGKGEDARKEAKKLRKELEKQLP